MARRGQELERVIAASWESVGPTTHRPACLWGPEVEGVSASRRHTWREHPTEEAEINRRRDLVDRWCGGGVFWGIDRIGAPFGAQPWFMMAGGGRDRAKFYI